MLVLQLLTDIAMAAVALLVTALAIYLALRLLGKLAKIFITLIVIALVAWLLLADASPLSGVVLLAQNYANFL